mmetsp:Transcript_51004/g.74711  ORF Transcript_51004/g.74711 Transcript_51004/m.74711 type:complete len:84 (-) Transcript_51004:95-346(-)
MFELLAAASCTAFHDNEPLTAWQSCPYSITWTCPTGSEPHIVSGVPETDVNGFNNPRYFRNCKSLSSVEPDMQGGWETVAMSH